jgi:DNA-binding transcriptional MerR regulator
MANVTVRTLHHYDAIGLLCPSERSPSGYRLYAGPDLERLARILYYRELGFTLDEVATILDDPDTDAATHLKRQHELLLEQIARLETMAAAVQRAMEAEDMNQPLTPDEQLEVFGWVPPASVAEEHRARAGGEPQLPTGATDWAEVEAYRKDYAVRLRAAFLGDRPRDSPDAMDLAEEHFQILRSTFDCTYEIQGHICRDYVDEPESFAFAVRPDEDAPGLAQWLWIAAKANAARAVS